MLQSHKPSVTPSIRTFISKVITPVVLLVGIIVLVYFNFNAVLKATQNQGDHFRGAPSFSQGSFAYDFRETAGVERPKFTFKGDELLTYVEWNSTISVDGVVQNLWDNDHNYSVDENKQQVYSTIGGPGWQLTEIVTLQDEHTATVEFQLIPRSLVTPAPTHYVLDISHKNSQFWYDAKVAGNTFTTKAMNGDPNTVLKQSSLQQPMGTLSVAVAPEKNVQASLKVDNYKTVNPEYGPWSNSMTTEYSLDNPASNIIVPLGKETITFQAA